MATVTSILSSDLLSNSRAVINTNFNNLNVAKVETSVLTGGYLTKPITASVLGSGTASPTTFLRGDLSWNIVSTASPGWTFVSYSTGSATSGFTISSLDLATNLKYKVLIELENTSTGNNGQNYYLSINSIATTTYNYVSSYDRFIAAYSTAGAGAAATQYARLTEIGYKSYFGEIDFSLVKDNNAVLPVWSWWMTGRTLVTDSSFQLARTVGAANETSQTNVTSFTLTPYSVTGSPTAIYRVWIFKPSQS